MGPHHYHIVDDVPPAIRAGGEDWLMLTPCFDVECPATVHDRVTPLCYSSTRQGSLMPDTPRPIKIHKIHEDPELTSDEKIEAVAIAMSEWAICQALVIVNGREHGWRKYYKLGGCIDQDADGDPVIMWRPGMKSRI